MWYRAAALIGGALLRCGWRVVQGPRIPQRHSSVVLCRCCAACPRIIALGAAHNCGHARGGGGSSILDLPHERGEAPEGGGVKTRSRGLGVRVFDFSKKKKLWAFCLQTSASAFAKFPKTRNHRKLPKKLSGAVPGAVGFTTK